MDLLRMSWTFLWLSFLCIGGGLGIIPELERQSVTVHQWLTAREFLTAIRWLSSRRDRT
jgi:chromate transport protein ChrA